MNKAIQMVKLECANCGVWFERKYRSDQQKATRHYCTKACESEGHRTISKLIWVCEYDPCGKQYTPTDRVQRFCSQSCAARYNNPRKPKKIKPARPLVGKPRFPRIDYEKVTMRELRTTLNTRNYHTRLRTHARTVYEDSGLPMECCVCGYTRGLDICHINPVSGFPDDTTIVVVNAIENLMVLDKLCHWEYDNGFLVIEM